MEDNTEIKTVFVPFRDGVYKLHGEPFTKKDWLKKLTDGPFRKAGIVIIVVILVFATIHYRSNPSVSWPQWMSQNRRESSPMIPSNLSITITKGTWSRAVVIGDRQNIRVISVDPPVRRLAMINDDPDRVLLLVGLASDFDLGKDVKTLRWMLAQDEVVSSATITYELY